MPQRSKDPRECERGVSSDLRLQLQRSVDAPAIARAAMAGHCQALELGGPLCQNLVLLVSELVSNAVKHSAGPSDAPIELVAAVTSETIRVAVTDAGEGFVPRTRDPGRTHDGYGLYLLEKVSSAWGVQRDGPTTVWFELPRVAPA
jgi:anti-sigma regulatory factor (Ser/Thr protein kinase)